MMTPGASPAEETISFINRDHIVYVVIRGNHIVVTTTAGTRISFPASETTVTKFADDLANSFQSNFVSISHPDRNSRFVDEGLDFITIDPKQAD